MYSDYTLLPEHMQSGMKLWIENGISPGSFLRAVIENNLAESFARADSINSERLRDFVAFLYQEAPFACWGSPEKAKNWQKLGGWKGMEKAHEAPQGEINGRQDRTGL